jgi:hypothetical protein
LTRIGLEDSCLAGTQEKVYAVQTVWTSDAERKQQKRVQGTEFAVARYGWESSASCFGTG